MNAMKIVCKKCGSSHFRRFYRACGIWEELCEFTDEGLQVVETFTDGLKCGKEPKTIRCTDCKTPHPNPDFKP